MEPTRKQVFENLIRAMCGGGQRIIFREAAMSRSTVLSVEPPPEDFGAVIGRQASHYRALEVLYLAAVDKQDGKTATLSVVTPDTRTEQRRTFRRDPTFTKEKLKALVRQVAEQVFDGGTIEVNDAIRDTFLVELTASGEHNPEIEESLKVVFNAVGKAHGVDVWLDLVQLSA